MRVLSSDGAELGSIEDILVSPDQRDARIVLLKGTLNVPDEAVASVEGDEVRLKLRSMDVRSAEWGEAPAEYILSDSFTIPLEKSSTGDVVTMPRYEERLVPEKHQREYGSVRIHKSVAEEPETIDVDTYHEEYDIERVPIERAWQPGDESPRTEGETIIVPLVEERLEVVRRKVVVEEVRLTKKTVAEQQQLTDTVRKERLNISGPAYERSKTVDGNTTSGGDGQNRPVVLDTLPASELSELENQYAQGDREAWTRITGSYGWTPEQSQQVWDWFGQRPPSGQST